ncbi:hypothetical protein EN962_22615 [Mesorhizobium sp. M7A.F.Ca.CA.001.09.2.1]|uniref:DUF5801 domain-containing protein n=2 Tax=Mesorhizobium TaxID=68287 RepID=A0AB38TGL6_9HYPH|nr:MULTISPECIES: DUF5801 repeats-in-toxin domain-containing protein [Mesorhizobium]RUY57465.1 hypothetical protein EN981_04010 [Mesorhizobium sp. M7A.F.Ca.CA.001.13.2.1]MDF3218151.1 DUF5801 repeats-in-toxin domain-containing protein [Mesorhizobium ciceri]RUY67228.1 hypothetical protein EN980_17880 [Mesorhizobium sp. M7A.F.Ca.CA.001.13.1.1]RUY70250.1 hypothetical protein EN965_10305 [Mesorhizobium sp. M7A.F.Ca.CA.001.05.1.1]RUY75623.1 hypothetical protein EN962_22615 [Mesorhizobium sp. M7A.F.Ca
MATINIIGDLVLDQSAGVQTGADGDDVAISVDAITGDISGGLDTAFLAYLNGLTLSAAQLAFADTAEAASQIGLVTVSPAAGENVVELEFAPLNHASSGLFTLDNEEIFLTTVQDGSAVEARDFNGDLVAAFYIIPNTEHTSATVQMITFEGIAHPDPLNPDDQVDFSDILKVRALVETSTPIGDHINVDDDGPDVNTNGAGPDLTVDESFLGGAGATTTGNFLANFPNSFGTDGPGTLTFALGIPADATDSGFTDTASQEHIFLYQELNGSITGRVGDGGAADANGAIAFTVSVNTTTAVVTLTQSLAMVHNVPGNGTVPPGSYDEAISLAATLITLTAHSEDADGDDDFATLNIGDNLFFKDDGPSISANGTVPTVTVDETNFANNAGPTSFAGIFMPQSGGADGAASPVEITYALAASGASGLTDTLTGLSVGLSVDANGAVLGTITGGIEVFRISIAANGDVTLDQSRAVLHANAADPNDTRTLTSASLIQLTATITDGDGDTAQATANIGTSFVFTDDGPTITKAFDGVPGGAVGDHETLSNVLTNPNQSASGDFGFNIGNDKFATYNATHSDFASIALSGYVTGLVPATSTPFETLPANGGPPVVTLVSESATGALFNWSAVYDANPDVANVQPGTIAGTLSFNKTDGTYTITLSDTADGFTKDLLHTSELLSKQPVGNTGHPNVVVEKLFDASTTPEQTDKDFFVQFTGNSNPNGSPFGFNLTGDGSPTPGDTFFNPHDQITSNFEDWVSATQTTNGVAGDTIQKGEALTLRFFETSPGILTDDGHIAPTQTANDMAIEFDGIGNSEDLMLLLNLVNLGSDGAFGGSGTATDTFTTKAMYVENQDIYKASTPGGVPSPYTNEFSLDNNDGLVVVERNDYNAAGENWVLQGAQIMQSGNGLTGPDTVPGGVFVETPTAINLQKGVGTNGGSTTFALQNWDPTDNDVLKITDIAFTATQTVTPDAHLAFDVVIHDADGDVTGHNSILVDVV